MSAPTVTKKLAFPIFGIGLSAISAHLGGPEAGAIVGSIANALNWFGGVFGNRTDALWSQPNEPDAAEVFRNHDLHALIRRAVLRLIENFTTHRCDSHGKISDTLRECAVPLADAFMAELDDPASPLHEIVVERDIPDLLTAFAKQEGDMEVLTDTQCRAFLERHRLPVSDGDQELWQTERKLLAEAIRCDFGTSLWNLTKIDSTTDGKAFAAVQMLYLSRILDAIEGRADAPSISVLEQHLDQLIQRLDERQARWFQRLWSQAERHHEADAASHQKTHRLLLLVLKRLEVLDKPSAPTSLHQLPPNPRDSGFIGREANLAKLRSLNPSAGAHLTGLKGMGGIGKTALAVVLAYEWAARFSDAQIFLNARGTQADPPSARNLMEDVIRAFHPDPNLRLPDDDSAIAAIYREVLGGKRALILLDNARDSAQAKPLIPPAGCALIVTSRQNFLLGTVAAHDVGRLTDAEAAALLREYHAALTDAEAAALVKLCAGLPLALRLAGSHFALDAAERGGVPDVAGYLRLLGGGRLAHLDADAADAGEVTISETLRVSEERLPEAERAAWRALGVFTASFDGRAAQAVAGADETMLGHFLRRSLLEREGAERFKVHDLAAEYACAQLADEDLTALRLTHARHYTDAADESQCLYVKGDAVGGLALFDRERAPIEAAYAWLCAKIGSNYSSLELATATASRNFTASSESEIVPAKAQDDFASHLLALVSNVVHTSNLRFHPRQRVAWLESHLRAARFVGDKSHEGGALGNLGAAYLEMGDAHQAIGYYEQALAISRRIGDRCYEGNALGGLGNAHAALGGVGRAMGYHEQHLVIAREIGDRRGEGIALGNLGLRHAALGDARQAIGYYEQQLGIAREIGDRSGEGAALDNLGNAHAYLDDGLQALGYYEQSILIAHEIGDQNREAHALGSAAWALNLLGNRLVAIDLAVAALAIYEAIENTNAAKVRSWLAEWQAQEEREYRSPYEVYMHLHAFDK